MKNKMINIIVVLLSACIFFSFFIFHKNGVSVVKEFKTLNIYWMLLAVIAIILFWTFETMTLYKITRKLYTSEHLFLKSVKFEIVGQFFGSITPLGAGGQPAQLYSMMESGIPAGLSGSILMIKFMAHESINILCLGIALFFKFNYFNSKIKYFMYFVILGVVINISVMSFAILVVVNRKITESMLHFILKVLGVIPIIKDVDTIQNKIEKELEIFHENAMLIGKHLDMCAYALSYTLLQWIAYFSITYFIYRSFGFYSADLWTIMAAQVFLTVFMSAIPLPGAEGGAEGGFYVIYSLFFKANTVVTALFIWRILTYYLSIVVSSIFILVLPNVHFKK